MSTGLSEMTRSLRQGCTRRSTEAAEHWPPAARHGPAQPARRRGCVGQPGRAPCPRFRVPVRRAAHPAVPARQGRERRTGRAHRCHHQVGRVLCVYAGVCARTRTRVSRRRPTDPPLPGRDECRCRPSRISCAVPLQYPAGIVPQAARCRWSRRATHCLMQTPGRALQQLVAHLLLARGAAGMGKRHAARANSRAHPPGV